MTAACRSGAPGVEPVAGQGGWACYLSACLRVVSPKYMRCAALSVGDTAALGKADGTAAWLRPPQLIELSEQCGRIGGTQYVGNLTMNDAEAS